MIQIDDRVKYTEKKGKSLSLLGVYRLMTFVIVPPIFLFLLLQDVIGVELTLLHNVLLIYTISTLILFLILPKIEAFKRNFIYAHFIFQSGVMILNLLIFYDNPGLKEGVSLFLASNLIGTILINPKATLWFYISTFLIFVLIGWSYGVYLPEITFSLLIGGIVITVFNYWRYSLHKNLLTARKTYQGIFDSSEQQVYVLSKDLRIIDLSIGAERYLHEKGVDNYENKLFNEVFISESEDCIQSFKEAFIACDINGKALFNANCSIHNSQSFAPKEFMVREGKYFGDKVYLLNVRLLKEQKEYENELIKNKENITKVLDNISPFVFNISFDEKEHFKHHVNYVSNRVEDVYGYSIDEYIALVKSERVSKDRHPDDKDKTNEKFSQLLKSGGKDSWQFRMKVRGEWRWIEEKLFIDKSANSSLVSVFGIVKDITREIEANEKIIQSEKKFKELFESNLAGVYKIHFDGRILDCNNAFAKILGYDSIEELKKIEVQKLYYNLENRKNYIESLLVKKQIKNYISILKRKDGRRLVLNNNVSIIKENSEEFNVIVGTVVDVTELHETTLALKHSEEKYRLLFEESTNAILVLYLDSLDSFVVDTNMRGVEMFGYSENELIGKKIRQLSIETDGLNNQIEKLYKDVESADKLEMEWHFRRKDGSSFYAEISVITVLLDDEKVAQIVIKDISERRLYEQEILESRLSFKNIVDQSPESILIFSDERLVYFNPKGEDLYLNILKSNGKNVFKIFPSHLSVLIKDLIKEADLNIPSYTEIDLGKSQKFSITVVKTTYNKEKAHIFILKDISLQNQYNTQKLRAELAEDTNISLQSEIENHKKTQQSLIESTSRLQALFESASSLFILSLDRDFKVVTFNTKFKNGIKDLLNKDIYKGQDFVDIFPIKKGAREVIERKLKKVFNGEALEMISHFPGAQGEVWMESFMNPIVTEGNDVKEISFIAHNITEQVENRKTIQQGEERNRAILLAVPDILFRVNNKGVITDFRVSGESNKKAFQKFLKQEKVINEKVVDVFKNTNVADEILLNVTKTLNTNELITHNFKLALDELDSTSTIHYENRYSKINDKEAVIISRNVTDTIEYEDKLIESVKEKEILLKEVHHRVKNNLQVINSILNLQSSYVKDEETLQIIIESQNRIRSMAYIHESLYQTKDFSSINFDSYISNLVQNLVHSYQIRSEKTRLILDIEKVKLALDQAIPCGLILNELITNSMKYAYPEDVGGEISISVKEINKKVHVVVKDFGIGLPKGFKIEESDSLGLSLVDTLIDQLDGQLILKTESGTEFLIIFDKQEI